MQGAATYMKCFSCKSVRQGSCNYQRWSLSMHILLLLIAAPSPSHSSPGQERKSSPSSSHVHVLAVDQARLELGEAKLKELKGQAEHSPCWKEAVKRLNSSCKLLSDVQQSKLAVAFANCHLEKSGRKTYPCPDEMSVADCTRDMDHDAFHTYTHFFTHTGHICYFLQIELWQDRTEGLVGQLSDTSSKAVEKLEQSLQYHRIMDEKQDSALRNQDTIIEQDRKIASSLWDTRKRMESSFSEMSEMAEKQKALLGEMFGSLQSSIDAVQQLMSLMLVEFIGYETLLMFVISWLVVLLLPQFRYSRFKLLLLLFAEVVVEVCVRRVYGYVTLGWGKPPADMSGLHGWLWWCRYISGALAGTLYVWEWYNFLDYGEKNYRILEEIRHMVGTMRTAGSAPGEGGPEKMVLPPAAVPLSSGPQYPTQPRYPTHHYPAPQPHLSEDDPDSWEEGYSHVTRERAAYTGETVWSSDEELLSPEEPDNDRAARRAIHSGRSSYRHMETSRTTVAVRHSPSPSPLRHLSPTPSLTTHQFSSEDEEDSPLTRSPIRTRKSDTPSSGPRKKKVPIKHTPSSRHQLHSSPPKKIDDSLNISPGNRPHPSDPEPEKEVMEEKKVPTKKRGLKPTSDLPKGSKPRQSQTSTPPDHTRTPHRYSLRSRTPKRL